jgi:CheY-like chemotaxis protein
MNRKLKEILLVDDSEGTNVLNKRILEGMDIVEKVSVAKNGKLALDYLSSENEAGNFPCPDIIFLDIRMPVMDGFQFLDQLHRSEKQVHPGYIVIMLTTSISEIDIERATGYEMVKGYRFKPLTREMVQEIINQLFKEE